MKIHRLAVVLSLLVLALTASGAGGLDRAAASRQGFHVLHWAQGGMTYWAVSDASEDRLRQLARLLRSS